jgi:hypothetical protein
VLIIDFIYWFLPLFFRRPLRSSPRGSGSTRRTGYLFAGFGVLGAVIQGGFIRPIVRRAGDKATFVAGSFSRSPASLRWPFASIFLFVLALVPLALAGFGHPGVEPHQPRRPRRRAGPRAGRRRGPWRAWAARWVQWGSASLQRFGEATPFLTGAAFLALTLLVVAGHQVSDD